MFFVQVILAQGQVLVPGQETPWRFRGGGGLVVLLDKTGGQFWNSGKVWLNRWTSPPIRRPRARSPQAVLWEIEAPVGSPHGKAKRQ
jgi:hypothetical protein